MEVLTLKVLVTGGAGYVGSTLVDELSQEGEYVRSLDNYSRGSFEKITSLDKRNNVEMVKGDIRDPNAVQDVMENVDTVVHLAALPGLALCAENPKEAITTNIYGTWNLLAQAAKEDVDRFVLASSAAVYGIPNEFPIQENEPIKPINLYGTSKAAGEQLVHIMHVNEELPTVVLRFANIYGIGMYTHWSTVIPKFVRLGIAGKPLTVYGSGKQSRDFIHVKDLTRGIIESLNANTNNVADQTFNLGSGKATSINTVANLVQEKIAEILNKEVKIVHTEKREGEPYLPNFSLSIDKINTALGFKPHIDLKEGIAELIRICLKRNP